MVHLQPCGERAVFAREQDDAAGVLDHGVDLGAIANDVGVGEKTPPLPPAVTGDGSRIETFKGPPESLSLLQDRQPRQTRLVDLEGEPLEERTVVGDGKTVFAFVVVRVPGIGAGGGAIALTHASILAHAEARPEAELGYLLVFFSTSPT